MNEYEWWHKITRKWFIQYSYENSKIGGKQNTPITNQWENQWENLDGKQIPRSQIDDQINEKIWMGSNIPRSQMKKKSNWWNYLEANTTIAEQWANHCNDSGREAKCTDHRLRIELTKMLTRGILPRWQMNNRIHGKLRDEEYDLYILDGRKNTPISETWGRNRIEFQRNEKFWRWTNPSTTIKDELTLRRKNNEVSGTLALPSSTCCKAWC